MPSDPTDTGGLFIGRRPGTGPVRYRQPPENPDPKRQRVDRFVAVVVLVVMGLVVACFWGPIPIAWLWIGAQINYWIGGVMLGLLVALFGVIATLMILLILLRRLDEFWILVRRAAGYDQQKGALPVVFAVATAIGATAFVIWLALFAGTSLAPSGIGGG